MGMLNLDGLLGFFVAMARGATGFITSGPGLTPDGGRKMSGPGLTPDG